MTAMTGPVTVVGVPAALGGHLPGERERGMAEVPAELRRHGFLDRLVAAGLELRDAGDLEVTPPVRLDDDPRAKNRELIAAYLPREATRVASAVDGGERLLLIGGDCCAHAGAMAGLRRARPQRRLAIAWFDAHGDFNTPDTTPSGHVWGMPFAMLCGRGDPDLVAACDGPSVDERHAALLGGQVLDEQEARVLPASPIAQFGAGMLRTAAGLAALDGWAQTTANEVDGLYIAIDHDVLDADEADWAVTMPERSGVPIDVAVQAVRSLAAAIPVVGYGATAMNLQSGDVERTVDAAVHLAAAALGVTA
jgi:arginase